MENKKIISVEVPNILKEALRVQAFRKDVTVSALIRQILETQLADTLRECCQKEIDSRGV